MSAALLLPLSSTGAAEIDGTLSAALTTLTNLTTLTSMMILTSLITLRIFYKSENPGRLDICDC